MLKRKPLLGATGTALLLASMSGFLGSVVYAQDEQSDQEESTTLEEVIVTGSIIKRAETATASPVSVLTKEELDIRGLNTVADAVTSLPSNNAGTMNASWSNYGFAKGATAVSLRGLTTSASLTIFDGLRMAPYPYGDDGRRNFVDLGTIPDAIVERIEVLKDGASSTYGADAVAGVVNVITKKEIIGLHLNGSYGISQEGDNNEYRGDVTWGVGDLEEDGFNFYVNVEAQQSDSVKAGERDGPWSNWDWSGVCNEDGSCLDNGNANGLQYDGTIDGISSNGNSIPMVRPYDVDAGSLGNWQLLNPNAGCREATEVNPSNAEDVHLTGPTCEENTLGLLVSMYPKINREGLNLRYTMKVGDKAEAYVMMNYYYVKTSENGASSNPWRSLTTPGVGDQVGLQPPILPVYVCPLDTVGACDATNGVLNPNNPFAADGLTAQLSYRPLYSRTSTTNTKTYRYAAGITGTFGRGDEWEYRVDAVTAQVKLEDLRTGYQIPRRLLNVISDGSFNFLDPSQNSQEMWDYIQPPNTTKSNSKMDHIQATLARPLFQLPGGELMAAVGLSYRRESLNAPNANPYAADPYERYYGINTVSASGSRNVRSAFFEIDAPLFDMVSVNLSGRYDDYSSGQSKFSPKVGLQFQPIDMVTLRGTYSEGFRIPSFNEAYGNPTTGYVTSKIDPNTPEGAAFLAAHGYNAYATQSYSIGLTATGNPSLDPEKSKSYTAGIVFEPSRNVSVTVDYWNIKINDLISGADYSPAIDLWYQNNGVVDLPGISVRPAPVDLDYPNALPLLGFIEYSYQNADSQIAEGIDVGVNFAHDFSGMTFTSHLETSYLMELSKTIGGVKQNYEGTLSPCDVTSCSGAPDWRATWVNSLLWQDWTFALTANYTGGYDNASIDYGGVKGDCSASIGASVAAFRDGTPYRCKHPDYLDWDFSVSYRVSDSMQLYANVLNVFDQSPTFDPAPAYALFGFNPAWELSGWRGRYFRVGIRLDF